MAGKGLSPCFAGCMVAGRAQQPGRIFAGQGAAPLRRLRRHLPLQGRLLGRRPPRKAPLQGELDAPEGADGGVHCRLAAEIPRRVRQGLTPQRTAVPQGPRGGRDRPPYIAAEKGQRPVNSSRLQRPTAGRCKHRPLRRGMRRPGECGDREGSFPVFCRVYGGREDAATRKDICRAGCGTPPPPAATPPLAGEAFGAAARCSRFCRPCALCCRAGVHARRGGVRRRGHSRLMQNAIPQSP